MFDLMDTNSLQAEIKVFGVGGAGGNAIDHMMKTKLDGVTFINANTDAQVLERSSADTILQLGETLTKGLGAGANPDIGREAAMEDRDRIAEAIDGADMVFITAGMGGGTGTGAAPVVAEIAKEKGVLTVAVVTKPFMFEGAKRARLAEQGLEELKSYVDSLITIPNQKVLDYVNDDVSIEEAFAEANNVLKNAVQGIAELITRPGLINVDFADVRTVMSEMGMAMMGSAVASGEGRAEKAAKNAISSPLLEDIDLNGARGLLVNVTASDVGMKEYSKVGEMIYAFAGEDANVVMGTAIDPAMDDELRVTVVATGLGAAEAAMPLQPGNMDAPALHPARQVEARVMPQVARPGAPLGRPSARPAQAQPAAASPQPGQQPVQQPSHQPDQQFGQRYDDKIAAKPTGSGFTPPSRGTFDGGKRVAGGGGDLGQLEIPTYLRNQQAD